MMNSLSDRKNPTVGKGGAMRRRDMPLAVARSRAQWRGTSGTAVGCSGPSRTEALGRGPAGAPRFGAGRSEPPYVQPRQALELSRTRNAS